MLLANKRRLIAIAIIAGHVVGGFFVYRFVRPAYAKAVLEDASLTLEYPAAWESSGFTEEKGLRHLSLRPQGNRPFDTFWDAEDVLLRVVEFPPGKMGGLEQHLLEVAANARVNDPSLPAIPHIEALALRDGVNALTMARPGEHDVLDIGAREESLRRALYKSLLVRDPIWTYIVFQGKGGKTYEITYLLPGDRLARRRYRPVYSRIVESLALK